MKKTYINPTLVVVNIKTSTTLLAGSLQRGEDWNGSGAGQEAAGRESSFDFTEE